MYLGHQLLTQLQLRVHSPIPEPLLLLPLDAFGGHVGGLYLARHGGSAFLPEEPLPIALKHGQEVLFHHSGRQLRSDLLAGVGIVVVAVVDDDRSSLGGVDLAPQDGRLLVELHSLVQLPCRREGPLVLLSLLLNPARRRHVHILTIVLHTLHVSKRPVVVEGRVEREIASTLIDHLQIHGGIFAFDLGGCEVRDHCGVVWAYHDRLLGARLAVVVVELLDGGLGLDFSAHLLQVQMRHPRHLTVLLPERLSSLPNLLALVQHLLPLPSNEHFLAILV
mmetsp:Transcript_12705/g.12553  ORF Transcript_12705/g.12553 Transcript_12705/m.12553 type:complete len:278 (+) Transcript_12705:1248-2081(+)